MQGSTKEQSHNFKKHGKRAMTKRKNVLLQRPYQKSYFVYNLIEIRNGQVELIKKSYLPQHLIMISSFKVVYIFTGDGSKLANLHKKCGEKRFCDT